MSNYIVEFAEGTNNHYNRRDLQVVGAETYAVDKQDLEVEESCLLFAFKCLTTPIAATFSSLSLPLLIIALEKRFVPNANLTLEQKLLKTMIPYSILVAFRTWLQWYRIGQRINGKADELIYVNDNAEDAPIAVSVAMIANISSFCNGFLLMMHLMRDTHPAVACSAGLGVGLLNYTVDLLTDIGDGIRKYSECKSKQDIHLNPFFKQEIIQFFFQHHIERFGLVLREIFPIITGIVRSQAATGVLDSLFQDKMPNLSLQLIKVLLGILIYEACAFFAGYEVHQLRDNLKLSMLPDFNPKNYLTQSEYTPLRLSGKIASGQLLIDGLQKARLSPTNRVYAAYVFATMGFSSLIYTVFVAYLFSTNRQEVKNDREGLLINYFLTDEVALKISATAIFFLIAMAITLGAGASFAQTGTLNKSLETGDEIARDNQITPEDEENHSGIMELT